MSCPQRPSCAHQQPCVQNQCLMDCLALFIPCVVTYLCRRRFAWDIAEEAASDAWMKANEWIADGRAAAMTSGQRRGYLCRAAFHIACNIHRRHLRSPLGKAVPLSEVYCHDESDDGVDPYEAAVRAEEAAERAEEIALLRRRLPALPDEGRCLLELHYWDGATLAQLADLLQCSKATAWRRVRAARDRLARLMTRDRSGR